MAEQGAEGEKKKLTIMLPGQWIWQSVEDHQYDRTETMTDILKRRFAPLTDEAWKEIGKQATEVIEQNLCGRRLVDISGPHGSQYGAVDLGRLQLADKPAELGVQWGMREVLPLIEVRSPFERSSQPPPCN
jgi:hypothetical protein